MFLIHKPWSAIFHLCLCFAECAFFDQFSNPGISHLVHSFPPCLCSMPPTGPTASFPSCIALTTCYAIGGSFQMGSPPRGVHPSPPEPTHRFSSLIAGEFGWSALSGDLVPFRICAYIGSCRSIRDGAVINPSFQCAHNEFFKTFGQCKVSSPSEIGICRVRF